MLAQNSLVQAEAYRSKVFIDPTKKLNEAVSLSIEDLENQLGSLPNDYAQSSAGRHLARHYVQEKQYSKAIVYYQTAMQAGGLSSLANQEMQQELATVYMLQGDYSGALSTLTKLQRSLTHPSNEFFLLLAQAQYKTGDYLALAPTLEHLLIDSSALTAVQLKQLVAISYGSGDYRQCEVILRLLIDRAPSDVGNWQQLVSVYLVQKKSISALNVLSLAKEKQLPLRAQDILLLANLYASTNAAEKGARVLDESLAAGELEQSGDNYHQLFQYWLLAREKNKATAALKKSVALKRNMDSFLQLARLQMEQELWSDMQQTLLQACSQVLDDRYVGRTNLLLGISQLKQGSEQQARSSFINASLMGGRSEKANQWLGYMNAAPATESEMREITGPCHPLERSMRYAGVRPDVKTDVQSPTNLNVKTVKKLRFYSTSAVVDVKDMTSQLRSLLVPMGINIVRGGGSIDGALHLLFEGENSFSEGKLTMKAGFPIRGNPPSKARYRSTVLESFKCVYLEYSGEPQGIRQAWETLYQDAISAGYELSGTSRQIINKGDGSNNMNTELQLGIM
jgi:tetratricopeptide (TPR) repeat protein